MKNFLIILSLVIFGGCQQGSNQKQDTVLKEQGTAEFVFQEELHNFGDLQAGEVVVFNFKFTNSGNGSLLILGAESDCGCVSVEFPDEEFLPGESGFIEVIFNSAGEVGRVYKEIRLTSNAEREETILAIAANVQNELLNIYTKN